MSNPNASLQIRSSDPLLSVVLPVYNEADVLHTLAGQIERVVEPLGIRYELVFVDDGSSDGSDEILDEMAADRPHVRVLHLSRNFGHQPALQAGLAHARGDAVIVMDSDMQDDPAAIPKFLRRWQEGFDVVFAIRTNRKESPIKRVLFYVFYRVLNAISRTPMPKDAGNFGLIDGAVARNIAILSECVGFFPGLRSWVGFRQIGIPVERHARHDDRSRVSLTGLFRLAKTAIFSFSTLPLSVFYLFGLASILVCAAACSFTLYHKLFTHEAVPGWTSMVVIASFFGAVNAMGIGVLGEYVIRIYDQVRKRPLFLVARKVNFQRWDNDRNEIDSWFDLPAATQESKSASLGAQPAAGEAVAVSRMQGH